MWGDMGHGKKNGREEQQWVTAGGVQDKKKKAKRREMTRKDRWAKDKGIGTEGNER